MITQYSKYQAIHKPLKTCQVSLRRGRIGVWKWEHGKTGKAKASCAFQMVFGIAMSSIVNFSVFTI